MAHDERADGPLHRAVADIQIRLILPVDAYAEAGMRMDDIADFLDGLIAGRRRASWDFIAFNTHPCKAIEMDDRAIQARRVPVAREDFAPQVYAAEDVAEPGAW